MAPNSNLKNRKANKKIILVKYLNLYRNIYSPAFLERSNLGFNKIEINPKKLISFLITPYLGKKTVFPFSTLGNKNKIPNQVD